MWQKWLWYYRWCCCYCDDNDDDDVEKVWALGSSNRCGAQTKLVSSLSFLRTLFLLLGGLLVKPLVHISIFPEPFSTLYQAIAANELVPEYPLWNPLQHFEEKKLEKKCFAWLLLQSDLAELGLKELYPPLVLKGKPTRNALWIMAAYFTRIVTSGLSWENWSQATSATTFWNTTSVSTF